MCQARTAAGKPCKRKADPYCRQHDPGEVVAESVERVDELAAHVGMLDRASKICEPRELPAILRERRITMAELTSLRGVDKGSVIDELAKRRADRRTRTDVAAKPGRGGVKRGR